MSLRFDQPRQCDHVADWSDLREGEIVEAVITAANTVDWNAKSAVSRALFRSVRLPSIALKMRLSSSAEALCFVTEANPRRGNLVLSRRAVLEREKEDKSNSASHRLSSAHRSKASCARLWTSVPSSTSGLDGPPAHQSTVVRTREASERDTD